MPRGVKYGAEIKQRAVARVLAGESAKTVAAAMGLSPQTVANWTAEERTRQAVCDDVRRADGSAVLGDWGYEPPKPERDQANATQQERDFALAILAELEVDITPEMLKVLLNAARRVLLK